eukprot:scaffold1166_cov261-Pinguiococcus_pyrenoidosus.AAC.39
MLHLYPGSIAQVISRKAAVEGTERRDGVAKLRSVEPKFLHDARATLLGCASHAHDALVGFNCEQVGQREGRFPQKVQNVLSLWTHRGALKLVHRNMKRILRCSLRFERQQRCDQIGSDFQRGRYRRRLCLSIEAVLIDEKCDEVKSKP